VAIWEGALIVAISVQLPHDLHVFVRIPCTTLRAMASAGKRINFVEFFSPAKREEETLKTKTNLSSNLSHKPVPQQLGFQLDQSGTTPNELALPEKCPHQLKWFILNWPKTLPANQYQSLACES